MYSAEQTPSEGEQRSLSWCFTFNISLLDLSSLPQTKVCYFTVYGIFQFGIYTIPPKRMQIVGMVICVFVLVNIPSLK